MSLPGIFFWALVSCLLAGLPATPQAGDFVVREWHAEEGLPHEDVLQLMQDRAGYLWVSCRGRLCRFDGNHFFPEDAGEARDIFYSLSEHADGSVLLAPRDGAPVRWRAGTYSREPLPAPYTGRAVGGLFLAADGACWYSLKGTVLRILNQEVQAFGAAEGIAENGWTRFAADASGAVWLAGNQFLACYEQGRLEPVPLPGNISELRIVASREQGPWVITPDRVIKFDLAKRAQEIAVLPPLLGAHYVNAAVEAHDGRLWLGTRSAGLQVLGSEGVCHVATASDSVVALLEDRDGTLWVGANAGGLSAVAPKIYTLYNKASGLAASGVAAVCADEAGAIWVANGDGGVACFRDGQIDRQTLKQGSHIFSAGLVSRHPQGGIWAAGGTGAALFRLTADRSETSLVQAVPSGAVRTALFTARNGDLWMTTSDRRVGRLSAGCYQVYGAAEGLSPNGVRCFSETSTGDLLVGTNDGLLLRFCGTHFERVKGALEVEGAINAIIEVKGVYWLGTAANGLVVLREEAVRLGTANGLPDDSITQLIEDGLGNVWCGSGRGVFRITISDVERFSRAETSSVHALRLGKDEGLGMINCQGNYGPGVARGRDGRLWFATRQGVLAIDPLAEALAPPPPVTKIEQLRVDDQLKPMTERWVVEASTRKLEITFSSLCLAAPSRVQTHYRLVGFDSSWILGKGTNTASYPQLSPGTYHFELGASFGGPATPTVMNSLEIVVVPLWWQTLWFRLFVVLVFATSIASVVRLWANRRLRLRVRNLERETAVARVRERIARDIHDEVGASLTRISLLTQSTQAFSPEAENLKRIDETAREVTLALDEIVWAVNPQHDSLEGFVGYLSDFAQKLLSAARMRCRLQIPAALPCLNLPSELRHDLFLCCREALNNVVKHAGATEVGIQMTLGEGILSISIVDNGRGLSSPPRSEPLDRVRHGHGLPNLTQRMKSLGGSCQISSPETGGTKVTLTVPVSPAT